MENTCKNCGIEVTSHYCPNCGQRTKTKRIDGSFLLQEFILNNFTFHNGLLYTMKSLILYPKQVVENYLAGKRARYTGAVQFFLFIIIFRAILSLIIGEHVLDNRVKELNNLFNVKIEIQRNLKSMYIIFASQSSIGTYLVYRNKKYNLSEHIIINFYIIGMCFFIRLVINLVTFYKIETYVQYMLPILIISYYIRIFYSERIRIKDVFKGIWCFLLIYCTSIAFLLLYIFGLLKGNM